jgi:hypothetical protein
VAQMSAAARPAGTERLALVAARWQGEQVAEKASNVKSELRS